MNKPIQMKRKKRNDIIINLEIVLDPALIPQLCDAQSEESLLFLKALQAGVSFHVAPNFKFALADYFEEKINANQITPAQAENEQQSLLSKCIYYEMGYEKNIKKSANLGYRYSLKDQMALHFTLKDSFFWTFKMSEELKKAEKVARFMSTTELETKIGDSLRALPMLLQHNVPYPLIEQDDIKNKQEKPPIIKTMDPRFEEIQAVSKPAGFYPEFVKWAVETYGFEKADDSGQTITLSSLPDPRILDKIRFINIVDFRKSVGIARIEIIDYKLPEKAIPYWGFFVSLTKYDYGSDEKELLIHDFFWNTLQRVEDKISVLSGHLIWGPKNGDILQGWEKCEDERSIKEKYGIELGELKSGVSRSYIQVFYQKDNKEESKTLSLRGLERKCKISKWEKSINDICLPTGDSLDEEKPASDGDEEDEDEEDEDKEDEDEEDEDEK